MSLIYHRSLYKIYAKANLLLFINNRRYKRFFADYKYAFEGRTGLEIGGPSKLFSTGIFPVYEWATRVDGCNFSRNTIWEGAIENDGYAYFTNKIGKQYILDGTDLSEIANEQYDFLLSCHNLEHIANPLKAVKEWTRVLKPGGFILIVLPEKEYTFDRRRNYTAFEHLLFDYKANTSETDLSHLAEILELHDLTLDPGAGRDFETFKTRGENNFINRALHHHVFSQDVMKASLQYFDIKPIFQYFVPPFHQIIMGQK